MSTTQTLNKAAQAQVDAFGNATARIGPTITGTTWKISTAAVSVTTDVLTPICKLYVGSIAPGNLIGGTYSGQQDSTDLNITLHSGQFLIADWDGADVGSWATLSVFGEMTIPGGS